MDKKYIIAIVVVAVVIIIAGIGLFVSGIFSNSFFVPYGTEYGPGTYEAGVDVPEGYYEVTGDVRISGTFYMSSTSGMNELSNQLYDDEGRLHLVSGRSVTVPSDGSIRYVAS